MGTFPSLPSDFSFPSISISQAIKGLNETIKRRKSTKEGKKGNEKSDGNEGNVLLNQVRHAGRSATVRNSDVNGDVLPYRAQHVRHPAVHFALGPLSDPPAAGARSSPPAPPPPLAQQVT